MAIALPIPLDAPVTIARRPEILRFATTTLLSERCPQNRSRHVFHIPDILQPDAVGSHGCVLTFEPPK